MRKTLLVLLLVGTLCCALCVGTQAWAGEVDLLIQKLVEKGLLTKEEAKALLMEMQKEKPKEEAIKEAAEEKAREPAKEKTEKAALDLPDWVKNTKFSGDFRLRYQGQDQINSTDLETEWRSRGRMRLRVGADTKIADDWKVGFQLASGGDDPRSTNATFDEFFSGKEIRIRKAYGEYRPWEWLKAVGGKFTNPLWQPKDMLWDTDVTPEGVAANLNYALSPKFNLLFNPGFFLLREFSFKEEDIYMVPVQLGLKWKIMESMDLQLTGTYYSFENLKGKLAPTYSSRSNSLQNGRYIYSYDPITASAAVEFKLPYRAVPHLAVYGQYINADTNSQDTGYCGGLRFGHKGVKAFGQWLAEFNYRHLERNAWVDFLSDSEFFGGSTNAKGYELEFRFGLASGISLKLDWYSMEKIDKFDPALGVIGQDIVLGLTDQDLLQVDLEFKF